jgi:hypothetical protein
MRSVQMTKLIVTSFKMVPLVEAVNLTFYAQSIDAATGAFKGSEAQEKAARVMLDELTRWTTALRTLRS